MIRHLIFPTCKSHYIVLPISGQPRWSRYAYTFQNYLASETPCRFARKCPNMVPGDFNLELISYLPTNVSRGHGRFPDGRPQHVRNVRDPTTLVGSVRFEPPSALDLVPLVGDTRNAILDLPHVYDWFGRSPVTVITDDWPWAKYVEGFFFFCMPTRRNILD